MKLKKYQNINKKGILQDKKRYEPVIRRWILRLMAESGLVNRFVHRSGSFHDDDVLEFIGLAELAEEDLTRDELIEKIEQHWRKNEGNGDINLKDGALEKNILKIQKTLNLTNIECEILYFVILLNGSSFLDDTADMAGDLNTEEAVNMLATVLDRRAASVRKALRRGGTLHNSGLIQVDKVSHRLGNKFDLLNGLEDQLFTEQDSVLDMVNHLIVPGKQVSLTDKDFDHIASKRDRIRAYLDHVLQQRMEGVNILIHGEPGVGKTELVRTLIDGMSSVDLYELSTTDEDGDPMGGEERFKAYRLSQQLLASQKKAVVLFDEIEDVFPSDIFATFFGAKRKRSDGNQKGWINALLETNPVPAFWISNAIHQIDPAYLRRFDLVVEIPPMTHATRAEMLNKVLGDLSLSPSWIDRMAHHDHLHPGQIQRAHKVVSSILKDIYEEGAIEKELETLIGETQVAMGNPRKPQYSTSISTPYSLNYLNSDIDLKRVNEGLKNIESARICLYGRPGTGKSAYASELAKDLGRPLISRKGSDLLGMYVGQTEQQIASMFQQAEEENAILLLDEGDSFLRDRSAANQSWEVTQVNELLVQMEHFDGIFIVSTNLMEDLDAASLRRFDFKVKFDYMLPEQTWQMFKAVSRREGINKGLRTVKIQSGVKQLANVTPGDFATVVRRSRVLGGIESVDDLLDQLVVECEAKPDFNKRRIGFV